MDSHRVSPEKLKRAGRISSSQDDANGLSDLLLSLLAQTLQETKISQLFHYLSSRSI